jgi:hypothetical protein
LVEARFAPGGRDSLEIDDEAVPYVRDVAYATGSADAKWVPVAARDGAWAVPCASHGCLVRYRFALADAADKLNNPESAIASGDVFAAPPSTWLLHPDTAGGRFRLRMKVSPPSRFTIAIPPAADGSPGTFEAPTDALEGAGFAVFGGFHSEVVPSGTASIEVAIAPQELPLSDAEVAAWVRAGVGGIAGYFGRFPAKRTLIVVQVVRAGSDTRGVTLGDGGPAVLVRVRRDATALLMRDDWVLTHELVHVSLPSLTREHSWLSEGLATYVEPIARARAGLVTPEAYWHDLMEGVAQGLPKPGDQGLDVAGPDPSADWMRWRDRTYWGGALFCLVADVQIREQTKNSRSLDDALRGIVATGADVEAHWTVEQFLEAGDRATGTSVLRDLYRTMGVAPGNVDLPALWQKLGVRIVERGRAGFDDTAPLAAIRRSMTEPVRP